MYDILIHQQRLFKHAPFMTGCVHLIEYHCLFTKEWHSLVGAVNHPFSPTWCLPPTHPHTSAIRLEVNVCLIFLTAFPIFTVERPARWNGKEYHFTSWIILKRFQHHQFCSQLLCNGTHQQVFCRDILSQQLIITMQLIKYHALFYFK